MCHKVVPTWSKWCSMLPLGRSGRLEILVWCCAKRSIYREARQRRDDDHRCQASQLESLLRRLEVSCSSAKRVASSEPSVDRSPFKPELLSELLRFLLLGSQLAQVRLPHAQPGNHCPHTPRRCAAACTGALAAARQPHTLCNLARLSRGLKSRDHGCLRISSLPDAAVTCNVLQTLVLICRMTRSRQNSSSLTPERALRQLERLFGGSLRWMRRDCRGKMEQRRFRENSQNQKQKRCRPRPPFCRHVPLEYCKSLAAQQGS